MTTTIRFDIERFRRLPIHADETWQGSVVRMPAWVDDPEGRPFRAVMALWVSLKSGLIHSSEATAPPLDPAEALKSLLSFASNRKLAGYRPGRLEVGDDGLAEYLRGELEGCELDIVRVDDLAGIRDVMASMREHMSRGKRPPGPLDTEGVTLDRMRAFARAAADFYRAELWEHLSGDDMVVIESPVPEPELACFSVLGQAGETFGLGFTASPGEFVERLDVDDAEDDENDSPLWLVTFDPLPNLPIEDADLWEDHHLPVAGENAYPLALCLGPDELPRRPGPDVLRFFEALFTALAGTTEDEIDTGRWEKTVTTDDGSQTIRLMMPGLMDSDEEDSVISGDETTLLERVESLVDLAHESSGRRRIQLARKALRLRPDCAEAFVLIAEEKTNPEKALPWYERGESAGRAALGDDFFREHAGHFWLVGEARPYMQARRGLADCLQALGRTGEAIDHYQELLRLNPGDNQGVRYSLLVGFLETGRNDDLRNLFERFGNDILAIWKYGRALLAFIEEGDNPDSRKKLDVAVRANPFVPKMLLGRQPIPNAPAQYLTPGNRDDAIHCVTGLKTAWESTPGAMAWLDRHQREKKKTARIKRKK